MLLIKNMQFGAIITNGGDLVATFVSGFFTIDFYGGGTAHQHWLSWPSLMDLLHALGREAYGATLLAGNLAHSAILV